MSLKPLRYLWLAMFAAISAQGCSRPPASPGLPVEALDRAIASAIGDPATCVLLADRRTGKVVYRYGARFNCVRGLPACDRPGFISATQALSFAGSAGGRQASCASTTDGTRMVGWAEGRAPSRSRDLIYSAMMEGETAMSGHFIAARLDDALQSAGL
jgi:hypothetical protein